MLMMVRLHDVNLMEFNFNNADIKVVKEELSKIK